MYTILHENLKKVALGSKFLKEHEEISMEIKNYILAKLSKGKIVKLIFICTHNSRRSHIGQILAWACAEFFEIKGIEFYSGGTEATAFHPNAIHALERFGFKIKVIKEGSNPHYEVFLDDSKSLVAFSKIYQDKTNPQEGFAAILVCDDTAENCPIVHGAEKRFKLTYTDPKAFDGTTQAEEKYYEKVLEILRDLIHIFSELKRS